MNQCIESQRRLGYIQQMLKYDQVARTAHRQKFGQTLDQAQQ